MIKYICSVCGYVHEGDSAPESCPMCKCTKGEGDAFTGDGRRRRRILSSFSERDYLSENEKKALGQALKNPLHYPFGDEWYDGENWHWCAHTHIDVDEKHFKVFIDDTLKAAEFAVWLGSAYNSAIYQPEEGGRYVTVADTLPIYGQIEWDDHSKDVEPWPYGWFEGLTFTPYGQKIKIKKEKLSKK